MSAPQPDLLDKLAGFARSRGIDVRARRMDVEKPGEFDGLSITLNPIHDQQALAFYFAQRWAVFINGVQTPDTPKKSLTP